MMEKIFINRTIHLKKLLLVHQSPCQNLKKIQLIQKKLSKIMEQTAVRLFILSDSPPEKDVQWSEQGMTASYKFVQKFWELHKRIKLQIETKTDSNLLKE